MIDLFTDDYFMEQALKEAKIAFEKGEIPVGAVVVVNKKIIARAHNQTETLQDVTAHAEILAITSAANYLGGKYLVDCTLYVTLEPCVMCAGALYWSQISRLVFAASDDKRGFRTHQINLHPKTEFNSGLMEEKAASLLKAFFYQKRNL
ncbi:MAG: tRNA-specific adenosine deaminase [Flavobacteriales bacterium CG_4_9_14_3_um_filter_40_17]|nr:MAG: tRNA-specific adenosine deaminase [Flavobacteriales bacterium CG_4_9_14_3_um_filter_40_17]